MRPAGPLLRRNEDHGALPAGAMAMPFDFRQHVTARAMTHDSGRIVGVVIAITAGVATRHWHFSSLAFRTAASPVAPGRGVCPSLKREGAPTARANVTAATGTLLENQGFRKTKLVPKTVPKAKNGPGCAGAKKIKGLDF